MQTAPEGKPATPAAQSFQPLPAEGEGLITMKALAAAMDVCEATVWDWAKTDPNFPTIIRMRPVDGVVPTRFEVADVIDLNTVRIRAAQKSLTPKETAHE